VAAPAAAPAAPDTAASAAPAQPSEPSAVDRQKLEAEFQQALGAAPTAPAPASGSSAPAPSAPSSLRLIDLAFDLLGAGGTSTAPEPELRSLQGGGHDPKNRGFTVQNVELTFSGVVDPYLRGDSNIVLQIDESGETVIELEEAYLTTLDLPFNLQLKAGQFFTGFGRLNPSHPHTWDFVDQPVINSRLFGADGLRSQGIQLAWLTPPAVLRRAHGQRAERARRDQHQLSQRAGRDAGGAGAHRARREGGADLLYLLRLKTSFDPSDELTLVPGASAVFGPTRAARRLKPRSTA
jgi:hypothetical protein